jgi:hypothetical protein
MSTIKLDTKVIMPIVLSALVAVIGWLFNTIEELQIAHSSMMTQLELLQEDLSVQESLFNELLFKMSG